MADSDKEPHPLDGCDPDECYRTMMTERTALITARQESEDNLVKTIIQLAAALLVLMAGFVSQASVRIEGCALVLFAVTMAALGISIIAGLTEHYFASKAYEEQQKLVEDYFQKNISTFAPAPSNKFVRIAQLTAFGSFVAALLLLGIFAFEEARQNNADRQRKSATTAATATTSPSSAATSAAAAATGTTSPSSANSAADRRGLSRRGSKVSGANDAATAPKEGVKR